MAHTALLRNMSLLSIVLLSLHFVDDIVRGISPAGFDNIGAVAILFVMLYGTLALTDRRSGFIIMILTGTFAVGMPILHMKGARYPAIATSPGGFFFVWTLIALGVTGVFTVILAARALWLTRSALASS